MDRAGFQQLLVNHGIDIYWPRGYRQDIDQLSAKTEIAVQLLADFARLRIGTTEIRIDRRSTDELRRAADSGSLLVVGEPGAGKSGALYDLVDKLREDGRDVVFLSVDRLDASSLGNLRTELGLEHDVTDVLRNWAGRLPGFLVIDALDAARAEASAQTIRDLIRVVLGESGRWHVIASVRKFDLRYSLALQDLFRGNPASDFRDSEFATVHHVSIPRLSGGELSQISSQSPELHSLINSAPPELSELLRVPLNVRLICGLLGEGVSVGSLAPIRTQLDLLDRYWAYWVIREDGQGDARESVLRGACEEMASARVLRVDRSKVATVESSSYLTQLLSANLLAEWQPLNATTPQRDVLAFSHHVLFDYAVARLLLRGHPTVLAERVEANPGLVLVIRPSLALHFRHVWMLDDSRQEFWLLSLRVAESSPTPEIGKIIGPSVATELAQEMGDLEPLCEALNDSSVPVRTAAESVFRHVVGALLTGRPASPVAGEEAGPWCELLVQVGESLRRELVYPVRTLLTAASEGMEHLTPAQYALVGVAGRRLLEFAWDGVSRDSAIALPALAVVCRTFATDPDAAERLLRRSLEPDHFRAYAHEELVRLARELEHVVPHAPAFVEHVYRTAFAHVEDSTAPTPMGGRILPLVSNRSQDYEAGLHSLAELFPRFLASSPVHAVRALIAVVGVHVSKELNGTLGATRADTFDVGGATARIAADYSRIWDAGDSFRHDNHLKMLDAFESRLEALAGGVEVSSETRDLVSLLVAENQFAAIWRRLIVVGAQHPRTVGELILPVASALPVLTNLDTRTPIGEYLKAVFTGLADADKARIEQAVMSVPDYLSERSDEAAEGIRNRLLGCLDGQQLVTAEAKEVLDALREADAVPANEPPFGFSGLRHVPYSEEDRLVDEGVPVDAEQNRRILTLSEPARTFAEQDLNAAPTQSAVDAVLPALQQLHGALAHAEETGVHAKQQENAWRHLAAACSCIAKSNELSCDSSAGDFARLVLVEASRSEYPVPDSVQDAQFEERPGWGPAARIEAAEGLILLARNPDCATPEVTEAVDRLSVDPVPAVRYQVARYLNVIYNTANELMWNILERLCREEQSRGVLQGVLGGPIARLAFPEHQDRVISLVRQIFDRVNEGTGSQEVRGLCTRLFTVLYVRRGDNACRDVIRGLIDDPVLWADEVHHVLSHLRAPMTHGSALTADPAEDAVRRRSVDLFLDLVRVAKMRLRDLETEHSDIGIDEWPEQDIEGCRSLANLLDNAGNQLFHTSGAFSRNRATSTSDRAESVVLATRFYQDVGSILDELADLGLPSLTHHLLETLEFVLPVDPPGVFLRIGRLVRAGQSGGYEYESMAADLIVRLVERYLAEYPELLRDNEQCRQTLLEVLDTFVSAGWPNARRLTYRMDEIFR